MNQSGIKKISSAAIFNYVGVLLGYINLIVLLPSIFSAEQIGQYQVVARFGVLFGAIITIGVPPAINRFSPIWTLALLKIKVLRIFRIFIYLIGVLAIFLAFFNKDVFPLADSSLYVTCIAIVLSVSFALKTVFLSILRVNKRIIGIAFFSDVSVRSGVLISTIICSFFDGLPTNILVSYYVGFELLTTIILAYYSKSVSQKTLYKKQLQPFSRRRLGEYMGFAFLTTLGSSMVLQVDTLMVAEFSNDAFVAAAIYSIAFFIATIVEIPKRVISQIAIPNYAEAFSKNQILKVIQVYKASGLLQSISSIIVFTIIWINIDLIFEFIANGNVYQKGKDVVFWIGITRVLDLSFGANNEMISNSNFYKFNLYSLLVLAVLNLILNYWFINLYDFTGASIATFISITVFNILKAIKIYSEGYKHPFHFGNILMIGMSFFLIFLISEVIPLVSNTPLVQILAQTFIALFCFAPLLVLLKPSLKKSLNYLK